MPNKPFIDYYKQHGIIPVNQDLSDLDQHFRRRSALYKMLGVLPAFLRNRSVIEFGPGSGDNAVYTASLDLKKFVLVDGNPASIESLNSKISSKMIPADITEIVEADVMTYQDKRKFDLVLCEGMIPGQSNPQEFTRHVASFSGEGGIVVVTTFSEISGLTEVCRRIMKPFFKTVCDDFEQQTEYAVKLFSPHLETLPAKSRNARDWVLDSIMHPWEANKMFTISQAIDALQDEFDFYGSSPKFLIDWRWYKSICEKEVGWNELAREQYLNNVAATIDYRLEPADIHFDRGEELNELCKKAYDCHYGLWNSDDTQGVISIFLPIILDIANLLQTNIPTSAACLFDFVKGIEQMSKGNMNPDLGLFVPMFGRGQQYLSFVRKDNPTLFIPYSPDDAGL